VRHLISKDGVWNDDFGHGHFDRGYADLANSVDYATSHDVAEAQRMMNYLLGSILSAQALGPGDVADVRAALDTAELHPSQQSGQRNGAVAFALYRIFGVFALLLTSVGMPMFLAGEEFGDVHDLDFTDVQSKQQDPVQFRRLAFPGNRTLQDQVGRLITLRANHPSLQRNEVQFFYFHPQFDDNDAPRVFGYARTAGNPVGNLGQVIVLANMGPQKFTSYEVPGWPWQALPVTEIGASMALENGAPRGVFAWLERGRAGALATHSVLPPADPELADALVRCRHIAVRLPTIPCLRPAATISSSVKSGCSEIKAVSRSACPSSGEIVPPLALAATLPVASHRCAQVTAVLATNP